MKIDNLMRRINHLIPGADCDTRGNEYASIVWRDARDMPGAATLQALVMADIELEEIDQGMDAFLNSPETESLIEAFAESVGKNPDTIKNAAKVKRRGKQ